MHNRAVRGEIVYESNVGLVSIRGQCVYSLFPGNSEINIGLKYDYVLKYFTYGNVEDPDIQNDLRYIYNISDM